MNHRLLAITNILLTSQHEPLAYPKNSFSCFLVDLSDHSAILLEIDKHALSS